MSVEEHLERSVSARIFSGGGLQNSKSFVNLRKQPLQMWRQSLFIRRRKKNARQAKAGAITFIRGSTVLQDGGLQFLET